MEIRLIFATNLRSMRESWGYSQTQAAELCGVEIASYNRWENGKAWPPPQTVDKLAVLFSCSPSYFYNDGSLPSVNSAEAAIIANDVSFSKLLELLNKRLSVVPSDIIDFAYFFGIKVDDPIWKKVQTLLESDLKKTFLKTPEEISQSNKEASESRRETLENLKKKK